MSAHFFKSLLCVWVIVLSMCGCNSSKPTPTEFTQNAMTIDYRILVGDPLTTTQKQQIPLLIQSVFDEIDARYNKWNPDSELSQLNALPAGKVFSLSPQLHHFLERVDRFVVLSEGRFDPTVEPLQQLWKHRLEQRTVPSQKEIDELKPCIGWHTIQLTNGKFVKQDGWTQLDLGGIAKGLCVDLLVERLHAAGYNHLYVEWGGEIRTLGEHPSHRPWRIYIRGLGTSDRAGAIAELDMEDRALATSGDYFQHWTVRNEKGEPITYCHIFNPLTLSPLEVKQGSIGSASLLARDCVTADALAKVLMLFDTKEEAERWFQEVQQDVPELACWIVSR